MLLRWQRPRLELAAAILLRLTGALTRVGRRRRIPDAGR